MTLRWLCLGTLIAAIGCTGDETTPPVGSGSGGGATAGQGGAATATTGPGGGGVGGGAVGGGSQSGSLHYQANETLAHDYGLQLGIPAGFGDGEFTMELWIKPDDSFPVGSTSGGQEQLTNWSDADNEPYVAGDWWYDGNFLLDGHNNNSFGQGTFSLQFYGGGRVRWLFGDNAPSISGSHWQVGPYPATQTPSLLDGSWHHLAMVRRWSGQSDAQLELWIDGTMVDSETSEVRTDMRQWFDLWSGFPSSQEGWFWGTEKQAVVGVLDQYEDYKGLVADLRFWSVAKTSAALTNDWAQPITGSETGLVGWYPMNEGSGTSTCDALGSQCMTLTDMKAGYWDPEGPPAP